MDFSVSDRELAEMRKWWAIYRDDAWGYGQALFKASVTLQVGEVLILVHVPAALYSLASLGLLKLNSLPDTHSEEIRIYDTSYTLFFRLENNLVEVGERFHTSVSATIDYESLLSGWRAFAERVRQFIVHEFPAVLQREDEIGDWFREPRN